MSHSFDHVIRWMELAKAQYDQLGDVVVDVYKALDDVAIQDIDVALSQVARKQRVAEWDSRINQLIREKKELQVQFWKTEQDLKLKQSKTKRVHRLIGLLEEHVRNPEFGDQGPDLQRGGSKDRRRHSPQIDPHLYGLFHQDGNHAGGDEDSLR